MAIKVIFIGPMGAGKTTAIRAISDVDPITTEAKNTDRKTSDKATTTVAMEYGEVSLGSESTLALYGVPGQKHFEYIWPIVSKGALGAVLLLDVSKPDWVDQMQFFLEKFDFLSKAGAVVIGLNRAEDEDEIYNEISKVSQKTGVVTPFFFTDPRDKTQVYELLNTLVINAELEQAMYEDDYIETGGSIE